MQKFQTLFTLTGIAGALLGAATDPAQAGGSYPVFLQSPVVVTGTSPSAPLIFVTDPKVPRQPLPASDATDYLDTIPGFSSVGNGGTNRDPMLRGQFGSRLNILSNGTSLHGACGGRMDPPTSYIAPANFDRLIVVKGPQTVLWGPGASAGTVRFERDTPHFTEPGFRFDGSLIGGSFGRNDQAADLTVGNTDWYTRVTANRSHSGDYRDGSGHTVPSRWDKWAADVTLALTPDVDTRYELSAGVGDGEARYASRGMDGTRFKRESVGLRLEKRHIGAPLSAMELQVYYNDADHVMDNFTLRTPPRRNGVTLSSASNVNRTTWGGRFATTFALANDLSLTTGADTQRSRHRGRRGTAQTSFEKQPWNRNATFTDTGIFGEMTWRPGQAHRWIGGARLDRADIKDWRGTTSKASPRPSAGRHRRDTLPAGFLRYEYDVASVPATWYVGVGHVERFPDYWELFAPGRGPSGSANAFQGVKPERTTQLDFGAQYRTRDTNAWFSAYLGRVQDYILFRYAPAGMIGSTQATNVKARILGGEFGLSQVMSPTWTAAATLAYSWAQNAESNKPLPQTPPLEGRLMATYDDGTWTAGVLWRLVATQHRYANNQGNAAGRDWGASHGFGVLSMNVGYAFTPNAHLTLGIDNVFNKTYREHLNRAGNPAFGYAGNIGFNEPGRAVWARLGLMY